MKLSNFKRNLARKKKKREDFSFKKLKKIFTLRFWRRENINKALQVLSVFGGVATLILVIITMDQLSELKKYNRLSTSPHIAIQIDQSPEGGSLLKINNYGGGYATLFGMHVKDKDTGEFLFTWKDVATRITGTKDSFSACGDTIVGYPFGAQGERALLTLHPFRGMISKKMNVEVSICYCSMYEECWESDFLKPRQVVPSCNAFEAESKPVVCNAN